MENLDKKIINRLQEIGSIIVQKGIPCIPVKVEYLKIKVDFETEKLILKELLLDLDDLLQIYYQKHKKTHRFYHYLTRFYRIISDNTTNEGDFIGKPVKNRKKRRF